jgi:hypothetical protein
MTNLLIETIISNEDAVRNRSIDSLLKRNNINDLFRLSGELERFRRSSGNLYHKVRASLFLSVIYRFHLQEHPDLPLSGKR